MVRIALIAERGDVFAIEGVAKEEATLQGAGGTPPHNVCAIVIGEFATLDSDSQVLFLEFEIDVVELNTRGVDLEAFIRTVTDLVGVPQP